MYQYRTKGTCSQEIRFELKNHTVSNVSFIGGCNGNLKAISKLVEGMEAERVIQLLKGNSCGFRSTSCADQLATALEQALQDQKER
jgi:uncharacterized protein (TIGR03905 family)